MENFRWLKNYKSYKDLFGSSPSRQSLSNWM